MNAKAIEHKSVTARPVLSLPKAARLPRDTANDSVAITTRSRGARPGWDDSKLTIARKPKPGQVYFIKAPEGARTPEFEGYHPGVIIRMSPQFTADAGTVVYVPLTKHEPDRGMGNAYPYVHRLSAAPGPDPEVPAWAVCDHLMTANVCRLELFQYPGRGARAGELSRADFDAILDCVAIALPLVRNRVEARAEAAFETRMTDAARRHADNVLELHCGFEERLAARDLELLEEMTCPGNSCEGR